MLKILTAYLTVTGAVAAVAMLFPGLVILGFYLLIIPGLLLALAPTAFLWGALFTLCWLVARQGLGETWLTAVVAAAVTALVLVGAVQGSRIAGSAVYSASLVPDVTPTERIAMRGAVRLDVPRPRWDNLNGTGKPADRGYSCDSVCMALLFTPGVTSVTINMASGELGDVPVGRAGLDQRARTYRLRPKAECAGVGLKPDVTGWVGLFPGTLDEMKALNAEWDASLANDVCLVNDDVVGRFDVVIRKGVYGEHPRSRRNLWSFGSRGPRVDYLEIAHGNGQVLLRRFKSSVLVLSYPLHISGLGSMHSFDFGWATTELTNQPKWFQIDLVADLEAHTDTAGRAKGVSAPAGPAQR